ncbi:hypothetical protein E2C01_015728 [Portunus trituberculatus]|uniref:Uncharacterized protein n=1 Tax=Portunus trituberculatus TaxID=210409 RepID=A0A5B7DNK6_PORTR|nr:hypothetical protein [Portunus trituberculatus]
MSHTEFFRGKTKTRRAWPSEWSAGPGSNTVPPHNVLCVMTTNILLAAPLAAKQSRALKLLHTITL